ncbi:MAG: hypothetical protein Kow00107_04430 [Planctomycetota bacterium]
MLQISAFTRGTFVSSLDVQTAIFENEVRGSSLWLDVYRPKDNEIMLFNRYVHEVPPTDNSFVFSLSSFKTLKRLIICRGDGRHANPSLIADATVLFANDLIVTIRSRGFHFNELIDYLMRNNAGKMPEDPHGLYSLLPQTFFGMFSDDLENSDRISMFSEKWQSLSEDLVYLSQMNWTLREMTVPVEQLLKNRDADSLTISILAQPNVSDRLSPYTSSVILKQEDIARASQSTISGRMSGAEPSRRLMPTLKIKKGPESGKNYPLDKSPIRIGREAGNDIILLANGISRKHVIITLEGGKVLLTDLGSTNGTYVNAKRIQQATLKAGDEIFIGNCVLEFNYA